jgi:glucokinase
MMPRDYYIAVDIGGTQLRAACFPGENTTPSAVQRRPTQAKGHAPEENLAATIEAVWPSEGQVLAIGVASPGPIDLRHGLVIKAPNIPQWHHFPIVAFLQDRFQVPVALDNDANLAALGEWKFGAGKGHHHLIYITVSTGIGGGVIIDDRLLHGVQGLAGELGHVTVLPDGPLCGCGQRGHLEAIASGTGIASAAAMRIKNGETSVLAPGEDISAREVAEAALAGDALCQSVLANASEFLGRALADYLHIFNPTAIIIGGGVSKSGDIFLKPMEKALRQSVMTSAYLDGLIITKTALGDDPGLLGALALAQSLVK